MHSKFIYKSLIITCVSALLWSCAIRENYIGAGALAQEKLFRTDQLPADSISLADTSWRNFFKDPILQKHLTKALENNLDIRIAIQNIATAEAYVKQSKILNAPTFSLGANNSYQTQSLNTQFGQLFGKRIHINQFDITGAISWEADIWGKLKAQQKQQLALYLASVEAHKEVKSSLVAGVASLYYQLLAFDEQKHVLINTILIREKNLETTKALKGAGILTEVAVQQSEALVYNAKSQLVTLDLQTTQTENALSLLLGEPSQNIERGTLNQQTEPNNIKLGYTASLLANRPDVKKAEYELQSAYELTNNAKAQFYPSLRITGSIALQSMDIDKLLSPKSFFANVVGGLTQPILNKRQIKTEYEVSLANREKAFLNFKQKVLTAGREVSDALKLYQSQENLMMYKKSELAAYTKAAQYSQELVNYGMANYLEVLNADIAKLNAEQILITAHYTKLNATVSLYQALGGGWK